MSKPLLRWAVLKTIWFGNLRTAVACSLRPNFQRATQRSDPADRSCWRFSRCHTGQSWLWVGSVDESVGCSTFKLDSEAQKPTKSNQPIYKIAASIDSSGGFPLFLHRHSKAAQECMTVYWNCGSGRKTCKVEGAKVPCFVCNRGKAVLDFHRPRLCVGPHNSEFMQMFNTTVCICMLLYQIISSLRFLEQYAMMLHDAARHFHCCSTLFQKSPRSSRNLFVALPFSLPGWTSRVGATHMSLAKLAATSFNCVRGGRNRLMYCHTLSLWVTFGPSGSQFSGRWAMHLQQKPTQVIWPFERMQMRIALVSKAVLKWIGWTSECVSHIKRLSSATFFCRNGSDLHWLCRFS